MIKWLSTLPIFKEIYRQGGIDPFALVQKDILETMADDLDKKAAILMEKKMSEMMSPVDWNHVLKVDPRGFVFIGGIRAEHAQLQALKAEAELLKASGLWKLLVESPNALAQQVMFKTGEDSDAFKKGRSMIYFLDSQLKIIETLLSYKAPPKGVV